MTGSAVVVSGPSGAGKGTLLKHLLARYPDRLVLSVSATTRPPRPGEVDGRDYYFLDWDTFGRWRAEGRFLEWAEYAGNGYGTPRAPVERAIAGGYTVILEIDVQGARQVAQTYPEAKQIFIAPPSLEILAVRLRQRGTDDEGAIARRLAQAEQELAAQGEFGRVIVNDRLEVALERLAAAVLGREWQGATDIYGEDWRGVWLPGRSLVGLRGIRADLRYAEGPGADLRGSDLRAADLREGDWREANLEDACLARARLEGADLRGANLTGAILTHARYDRRTRFPEGFAYTKSGAIGPGAQLNGARLNTGDLRGADLQGASLLGAYLGGADLTGADLQGAKLSQADLRRAYLTGANLCGARLNGVNWAGADLRGVNWQDVTLETLEDLAGADFGEARNLPPAVRELWLRQEAAALDTWNPFTRRTTRESILEGPS